MKIPAVEEFNLFNENTFKNMGRIVKIVAMIKTIP